MKSPILRYIVLKQYPEDLNMTPEIVKVFDNWPDAAECVRRAAGPTIEQGAWNSVWVTKPDTRTFTIHRIEVTVD